MEVNSYCKFIGTEIETVVIVGGGGTANGNAPLKSVFTWSHSHNYSHIDQNLALAMMSEDILTTRNAI